MTDTKEIVRQWTLLRILSARRHGASYDELVQETGVVRRTIYRDLTMLAGIGFPIKEYVGERRIKRWRIDDELGLTQLNFTLEEAAALYLGRQFLEPLAGTLFHAGARSAFQKIRATLGDAALRHLEKLAAGFYHAQQGWTDYADKAQLIDEITLAIEERKLSVITYQSLRTTEPVTLYDVYPYALVFHRTALYLIAYAKDHDQIRTFKVDRIKSITLHDLKFPAPKDFSPQQFLENSFGIFQGDGPAEQVKVLFRGPASRILEEKQFHPSQRLIPQRDNSIIAEYQLSSFEELSSWILSFGPTAEVLEPQHLRAKIIDLLHQTTSRYTNHDSINSPTSDGKTSTRKRRPATAK